MSIRQTFNSEVTNGTAYTNFPELDPSNLFLSSEMGLWWDCSNAAVLYTDTARTTPINGDDGDLVLGVEDKSGNGLHANNFPASPSSNIRYATDSFGYRCLQFDADNKDNVAFNGSEMNVQGASFTAFADVSQQWSVWVVAETTSDASLSWRDRIMGGQSSNPLNRPEFTLRVYVEDPYQIAFDTQTNIVGDTNFGALDYVVGSSLGVGGIAPNTKVLLAATWDYSQIVPEKAITYRVNGRRLNDPSVADGVYANTAGTTLTRTVYDKRGFQPCEIGIGNNGTSSSRWKGKIYEVIWAHYRVPTSKLAGVDKYLCRKHGIPYYYGR